MNQLSDKEILRELGQRVRQRRLNMNMTQEQLAEQAGLHVQTIKKFEAGKSPTLLTFIQVLRAFGDLQYLDQFMPPPGISPVDLLKLRGKERERASGTRVKDEKKYPPAW